MIMMILQKMITTENHNQMNTVSPIVDNNDESGNDDKNTESSNTKVQTTTVESNVETTTAASDNQTTIMTTTKAAKTEKGRN